MRSFKSLQTPEGFDLDRNGTILGNAGTDRDRPGQSGTERDRPGQTGTERDRPGQTGTERDRPGQTGTERRKRGPVRSGSVTLFITFTSLELRRVHTDSPLTVTSKHR
ncbi:hypothetical protein D9C73_028592 [Collichthys lucidus]|uniref:Uncharacterized protein n=1 Tax=Collichthys lucidus TaxID=240159 RepID=A0A4U5TUV6_COLLU|nr:hypothetical protein D9C73_028592 [Collichthys lucidus]